MRGASRRRRRDATAARGGDVHGDEGGAGAQRSPRRRRGVPGAIRQEGGRRTQDQVHDGRHPAPRDSERLAPAQVQRRHRRRGARTQRQHGHTARTPVQGRPAEGGTRGGGYRDNAASSGGDVGDAAGGGIRREQAALSHAAGAAEGGGASVPRHDPLREKDRAPGLPGRREEEGARDTPQAPAGRHTGLPHRPEGG